MPKYEADQRHGISASMGRRRRAQSVAVSASPDTVAADKYRTRAPRVRIQPRRSSISHRMWQPLSHHLGGNVGSGVVLHFTSAGDGEPDSEAASGRNPTIHFDGSSMRGADGLDNRQSESHTTAVAGPRIVHTVEPIKQVRQGAWRNTDPGVPDFEHTLPTGFDRFQFHHTAARRIFQGVVKQVYDDLLKPRAIALYRHRLQVRADQADAAIFSHQSHLLRGRSHEFA